MPRLADAQRSNEPGACLLCAAAYGYDSDYFARSFDDPQVGAATAEAISETLGFCARHGVILLARQPLSGEFARVLRAAIRRIMLLLSERHLQAAPVQQILFGTDGACPACSYTNRALGRQAASLGRRMLKAADPVAREQVHALCLDHFRMFEANLAAGPRLAALTGYTAHLEHMSHKMKALLSAGQESDIRSHDHAAAMLRDALGLVAGRAASATDALIGMHDADLSQYPALAGIIGQPDVCPLCIEAERARRRWLKKVQHAAALGQDAWLILPTCPQHIGMVARLGEPQATASAVARALNVALRHNHRQMQTLVAAARLKQEEARIKAEGPEVWLAYKRQLTYRKRTAPDTAKQNAPSPRAAKCPACEWDEIAAERATGELVDLLHEKKHRNAFGRGYGLCLKHFARVYLIAPKGAVRTMLAEDIHGRLAGLARHLDAPERNTRPDVSLPSALRRFCSCI